MLRKIGIFDRLDCIVIMVQCLVGQGTDYCSVETDEIEIPKNRLDKVICHEVCLPFTPNPYIELCINTAGIYKLPNGGGVPKTFYFEYEEILGFETEAPQLFGGPAMEVTDQASLCKWLKKLGFTCVEAGEDDKMEPIPIPGCAPAGPTGAKIELTITKTAE